jgi:hypothetical protein
MGRRIPNPIRIRVAQQWIAGVSRDVIAKDNKISTGTVSTIIRGFKDDGFDLDLLREVALLLKREGLEITLLPSSVRLRKRLEERGLNEMQVDSLIETIDVHCFRRGIAGEQFVDTIQNVSSLSENLVIPIEQLPQHVAREKEELESHKKALKETKLKIRKFLRVSRVTLDELEDYKRDKAKLQNYEQLEKQLHDLQQLLNYYSDPGKIFLDISKEQLKNINKVLIKSITEDDLIKMLYYLCANPIWNINIFTTLQKRALEISNDKVDKDASFKNER